MPVSRLDIHTRAAFAGNASFGPTGPYERIEGVMHFTVDPVSAANRVICDIDKAPRNERGLCEFTADFWLLQPRDPTRGDQTLLIEAVNRGRVRLMRDFDRVEARASSDGPDPDDGFLFRHGFTLAAVGWQWDVIRASGSLGLDAPTALDGAGRPLGTQVVWELQPFNRQADALLANRLHQPYVTADVNDPTAVLTVRDWPSGPRTTIPRERWRFARDDNGKPVAAETHVWLDGGFEPGKIFELLYRSRISPVVGAGLLAYRDAAAFLRYASASEGNPTAGSLRHAIGYGASQGGRFLRHLLYLGLDLDEAGRIVFDGLMPVIAGGRRGEFNHRGAQPSLQSATSPGALMPFSWRDQTDPLTGHTDGLLRRRRAAGGLPKIVAADTSAEYWRGDGMLSHATLDGTADLDPPDNVREYLFASTQHMLGVVPLIDVDEPSGARGANTFNALSYAPLQRALLMDLLAWVRDGVAPPPSAVPAIASGTARPRADVLRVFERVPGASVPDASRLTFMRRLDYGESAASGVMAYPPVMGEPYPTLVSAVDPDGNEVAGIRLPEVSVPLATHTGWNPRHPKTGGPGQVLPMRGSTTPFAATAKQRAASGDPRPSIEERYASRDDYAARVRAAAIDLTRERFMLEEDVELSIESALKRYDYFVTLGRGRSLL